MPTKANKTYRLTGTVIHAGSRNGLSGLRVEAWDKDQIIDDLVGSAVTDEDGAFSLEFDESYFAELFLDRKPDLFFKVFRDGRLIKSTETSVLWNAASNIDGLTIEVDNDPAAADTRRYTVAGTVLSPDRAGVGGLRVQIVDRNVGQDVPLAEAVTDARGRYQVSFDPTSLSERRKAQPDLVARVYADKTFLAASEVRYNAAIDEVLHIRLPPNAAGLPSEHETLTGALSAHYSGKLSDLKESGERQDITYLAHKSGWDARAVALAALADQFSARLANVNGHDGIAPAFFYALFRAGLPANEDALYLADVRTVAAIWNQAVEQGVIPKALAPSIPQMAERFQSLSAQKRLTGPALVGASPLNEMLSVSRLDDARQAQFARLYTAHRNDMPALWEAVEAAFGPAAASRLRLDGRLAFLTLNNAPLMQALHSLAGEAGLSDPVQLAHSGYYRAEAWQRLLEAEVPIPKEMPGDTLEARRENYARYLAAQVRLSYPTAAVASMVQNGDLRLRAPAAVHAFLREHQGRFEIAIQPVQQYIARNHLQVDAETVAQLKQLQRVYQITPNDEAMAGLLRRGLDAAYHIVRYDRETFVQTFAQDLGGMQAAGQTYDRSVQIHNIVLNVAIGYLTAKNGIGLGTQPLQAAVPAAEKHIAMAKNGLGLGAQPPAAGPAVGDHFPIIQPYPAGPSADAKHADDVIAYPTLEGLFGELDFCACDHCRSILSPAAYLVDLLLFIDQAPTEQGKENPQTVLLARRPDIQHLPLTCENTNTALPYIDVVNETLEYFIANTVQAFSLDGYAGHDTGTAASEDLLASPQFVMDSAYTTLRNNYFPLPLPFHQPLETLRRHFDKFGVPLPQVMERLRQSDALERPASTYGWRDIWMEELRLSRAEYEILTDAAAVPLWRMYGFPMGTAESVVIAGIPNFPGLCNARQFTRRVGISYDDLIAILKTRFVNPNADLIPKLERLGVSFVTMQSLKDGGITDEAFNDLLAPHIDPRPYGLDAQDVDLHGRPNFAAWVKDDRNYSRIMGLITLADPSGDPDPCSFETLEFRYATPMAAPDDTSTRIGRVEFIRLLRFIRLWKKLGWTIEQTDAVICALWPSPTGHATFSETLNTAARLDAGFLTMLPRLGLLSRVMALLNLTPRRDLLPMLACWSEIGTHGEGALYRQMFLNPAMLAQDPAFDDNGYGEFLVDGAQKLADHAEALRSAFNLTGDEYDQIAEALDYDANTNLTLPNLSAIFRRGYLARKLRLSVRELLLLASLTGLDPFAAPDPTRPAILRLIDLVQALKDRSLKSAAALYLIWNQDLSGKSAPDPTEIDEFARSLRADFAAIDDQFAAIEDPGGDVARARMALVYGKEAADAFCALLDETLALDTAYTHPAPTLESAITVQDSRLSYDDFRHRLAYTGVLSAAARDGLKAVAGVAAAFQAAVDDLFFRSEDARGSFFTRYPELEPLYEDYIASPEPPEIKRAVLLAAFQPELSRRRKRQHALQRLSAAAAIDLAFAQTLLDPPAPYPLHAATQIDRPLLDDVLALETTGLAAQFFFSGAATGTADVSIPAADDLDYGSGTANILPVNPSPGAPISGVWNGQLEAPEAGFYNLVIEADLEAIVTLTLDELPRPLAQNGSLWRNADPLELNAGVLYEIVLTVENVKDRVSVKWETPKRPRDVLPPRSLYPPALLAPFADAYLRFLKVASLAAGLKVTANELAHFATHADYAVAGDGWLNLLPVRGAPDQPLAAALLTPFQALLEFARLKAALSPGDESLLAIIKDPAAAAGDDRLFTLTRWEAASLDALLAQLGGDRAGLAHWELFHRMSGAFDLIQTLGISGQALIAAATNEPAGETARDLQAALRARYEAADWRQVVQPINDTLRALQRDALVAFILHHMRSHPSTDHIDTADKLFEYFLMDVQMEPCMQTSRIRHALSSVQLFIERCLMNLEPGLSLDPDRSRQWEWMKRYRVWEANRKVFLTPENWLEPELRDDKSPFFKELEGELLQGDITEESAAIALLNYLGKLKDVAQLEPCGIHYEPGDQARVGDVEHVVARATGAGRKYYYRRKEADAWTAWESIPLDVEENPVLPAVWDGRLFLFWLRILKQAPDAQKSEPDKNGNTKDDPKLKDAKLSEVKSDKPPRTSVRAILCWSEYFNGKWQPARTSDVARPLKIDECDAYGDHEFNRSDWKLSGEFSTDRARIIVSKKAGQGASFYLHNTYGVPEQSNDQAWYHFGMPRAVSTQTDDTLKVTYAYPLLKSHTLLKTGLNDHGLQPHADIAGDPWQAPFFYWDGRHVFHVITAEHLVLLPSWDSFGPGQPSEGVELPPLSLETVNIPDPAGPVTREPGFGVADPAAIERFVTEDAYIRNGIGSAGTIRFDGKEIGPAGSLSRPIQAR